MPINSSEIAPYAEGNGVRENGLGGRKSPAPPSKITSLPFSSTVYNPKNESNETADLICPETHGFNMMAEQAYLHRRNINLAEACMDLPAKADAARYLAQNGINIYAPCDRFASLLMNYKEKNVITATILGSAPIRQTEKGAVIGDHPVVINSSELIVVEYTNRENTMDRYCDTPWRYFNELEENYNLNLSLVKVYANAGEADKVVKKSPGHQSTSHSLEGLQR